MGRATTRSRQRRLAGVRLAVVGKGGSGKSFVAGTLARILARRGHRVLALDSDPMPGLALSLGVDVGDRAMLEDYAEQDAEGNWRFVRNLKPATIVRRVAAEAPDGVLFLQYGKVETRSLAPLMGSLQAFWIVTQQLSGGPWTVVHDLPAGTRQPFAGWAGPADLFLLVVEPTQKSILSARRLSGIIQLAGQAELWIVANKVRRPEDIDMIAGALPEAKAAIGVPFDPSAAEAEQQGLAPIDQAPGSAAIRALEELAGRIESLPRRDRS
jgi:CO dehydrogenase maturation factor